MNWFVLTLPEPEAAFPEGSLSWARIGNGSVLERGSAPLAEIPAAIQRGDRVLALVPGERVLLYHVAIPARSRSAQRQALPYALEERLSEDLEAMHIVPGPRLPDGRLQAAVAARRDMDAWLEWLREAGIDAQVLIPDTALLPEAPPDRLELYWAGDRCLVSVPGGEPLALADEVLPWWLQQWKTQQGEEMAIAWHGPPELAVTDIGDGTEVRAPGWDGDLLTLIAPALGRRPGLNLLTGSYTPAGSGAEAWSRWRVPAAIAAALVLLWTGSLWLEVRQLEREVARVDLAIADLFEATLPNTRMIDPVGQFRQVLDAGTDTAAGAGPIADRLGRAAPVLAQAGVELRQLRGDGSRLELELDLDSISALDSLRSRLREGTDATVRILSAESDEQGVRARLQIEGGGS
nr:type II secretion system protein GspL [Thioalkalivibrio sp.]